jgi:hypothetical protein
MNSTYRNRKKVHVSIRAEIRNFVSYRWKTAFVTSAENVLRVIKFTPGTV